MSEQVYKCEYCNKILKNNRTLTKHKTTSQSCLQLQNKQVIKYNCDNCEYSSTRKDNVETHKKHCKKAQKISKEDVTNNLIEEIKRSSPSTTTLFNRRK